MPLLERCLIGWILRAFSRRTASLLSTDDLQKVIEAQNELSAESYPENPFLRESKTLAVIGVHHRRLHIFPLCCPHHNAP